MLNAQPFQNKLMRDLKTLVQAKSFKITSVCNYNEVFGNLLMAPCSDDENRSHNF